ncbi:MAG: branched-chain amino acid ABC transporter permease [Actinomycetota bacterium]
MATVVQETRGSVGRLMGWRSPNAFAVGALLVAAVALPLVWRNDYVIDVALTALIWMVLNQSWNLQLGIGGIWNFGQLAIFAIGGYVAGLVSLHWGIPPWLSLIMGGVAAALVSAVIGIPVLRLRGIYASLLTFSFGEVVRLLVISDESGLTGGSFGLSGIPGLAFEGLSPDAKQRAYYWLVLGLVVLTAIFIYVFIHSPLGTALKALRDSPAYAASRGVSPLKMQVITFGTSAFIAGVAGAFYAQYFGTISPSVMGLGPLSLFVAMLVVGGLGTFWGPMLGTAVIVVVSEVLRDFEEARLIIVGLILLVTIVLAPRGLVPLLQEGWDRLQRWMAEDEATEEETTEEVAADDEVVPSSSVPEGEGR